MCNKFFVVLFFVLKSAYVSAQISITPSDSNSEFQNALNDGFTEFSPVFPAFINQNRRLIESGQFKAARESLTPFIDQFRARLGFTTKSHIQFGLKNFDENDIALTHKEMVGSVSREMSFANLSSGVQEKLTAAVNSSLPNRYIDSLFIYKRVLLLYLTSVLGEHSNYSGGDKQNFSRTIFSDFLFLLAPALRFDTAESSRYLILYEFELNNSPEQFAFESDLLYFVRKFSAYFSFVKSPNVPGGIDADYKRFKLFQQDLIRKSLAIKTVRKPANQSEEGSDIRSFPASEQMDSDSIPQQKKSYSRPTAVVLAQSKGILQFDLNSLTEIADSDVSTKMMAEDLKVYFTSSTMTWGQNQIQFNSSFTHFNSNIKVLVKNFPLNEKFISAATALYYSELYTFFLFGKEALMRKNSLESRNQVYNCLVRMSLAPITMDCDHILAQVSMYDEINRKKLSDSYTRLLRFSRITFEFSMPELELSTDTLKTCDQIKALQASMLNHYKSTASSYLPSLISIQGPAFKNTTTGQREYLCKGSLNPFLQ